MTPRQRAVLEAIQRHYATYGVPPTIRYIMQQADIPSSDTVHYYYRRLAKQKEIVLAGSPGSQPKPVPTSLFNLITKTPPYGRGEKESLPHEIHLYLDS